LGRLAHRGIGQTGPVSSSNDWPALRRLRLALLLLGVVLLGGSLGYWALGTGPLDAVYRAVTVVTTVGFQQRSLPTASEKVFTVVLVMLGVGTALYAFGSLVELLVEGQLVATVGRRRMERRIAAMSDHVVICGWGRVGRVVADQLARQKLRFVVIDIDGDRLGGLDYPSVVGDATDDNVLRSAGIERAKALVAVMSNDAADLYVILSGRSLNPGLFIIGRARVSSSEEKMLRAGADRVINPQSIGGERIAALLLQPHVAEFVDVVTREAGIEFRLEELGLAAGSSLCGKRLEESHIRRRTGALVLAVRQPDGTFLTNPAPDTTLTAKQVLIAFGTRDQLLALAQLATP
jgi:voltage-gated potassium channel